ncbi:hypothetical protein GCM10010306_090550 [Streptomyces umbrinus]|nr:hypothetical protein GCM10010306_090550 [Streptomyces umbrinus]
MLELLTDSSPVDARNGLSSSRVDVTDPAHPSQEELMNPVPVLTPVPPAFERQLPLVHGVDATRAFAADPSRPEPRWGA